MGSTVSKLPEKPMFTQEHWEWIKGLNVRLDLGDLLNSLPPQNVDLATLLSNIAINIKEPCVQSVKWGLTCFLVNDDSIYFNLVNNFGQKHFDVDWTGNNIKLFSKQIDRCNNYEYNRLSTEAPSCKLELERFSVQLRIQDGAECGNNYISCF